MAKLRRKSKHSPAGKKWLGGKSVRGKLKEERLKRTKPVYFKGIRKPTVESQLRKAGLSDSDLAALGYKRKKR